MAEGGEGTAQETHAAGASAVHRRRLGARARPGSGGAAPNRQRPQKHSEQGTCGVGAGAARTVRHRVATTACPAFLNDGSIELSRHPGEHMEGPRSGLRHGSGPLETARSPQLSADFVAEVGDQKGEAAEVISSSCPFPLARLGAAALTQWH